MRLKQTEFAKEQYYHLYNHSVPELILFHDNDDYLMCLRYLQKYYKPQDVGIVAYCLMPNHYHFLLYQKSDTAIYKPFSYLWYQYTCYYNKKYGRKGTVFASKLQHIGIMDENYLLNLCAYIHINPLKAGIVERLEDWHWSNYPEWIGARQGVLCDREIIRTYFKQSQDYKSTIETIVKEKLDTKYKIDESLVTG